MPDTEIADDLRMVLQADKLQWLQSGPKSVGGLFQRSADELERLQAENAALKARLVIDDAMKFRAADAIRDDLRECDFDEFTPESLAEVVLEAALGTKGAEK